MLRPTPESKVQVLRMRFEARMQKVLREVPCGTEETIEEDARTGRPEGYAFSFSKSMKTLFKEDATTAPCIVR